MAPKTNKTLGKRKRKTKQNDEPKSKQLKPNPQNDLKSTKNQNHQNKNKNKNENEKKPKAEIKGVLWEELTPTQLAQHLQAIYELVVQDFHFNFKPSHIVQVQGTGAEATSSLMPFQNQPKTDESKAKEIQVSQEGAPVLIYVSSSGKRACDVVRELRPFGKCAKLISKMKLHELRDFLSQNQIGLGAGTAPRIQKLIEEDMLSLVNLEYMVIDLRRDAKTWTVLDMKETRNAFMKLLNNEDVRRRIVNGQMKLCFWTPPEEDNAFAKAKKSESKEEKQQESKLESESGSLSFVQDKEENNDNNDNNIDESKMNDKKQKKNNTKKKNKKNKKKQE